MHVYSSRAVLDQGTYTEQCQKRKPRENGGGFFEIALSRFL